MSLPQGYIDDLIKNALNEDINYLDVTTDYMIAQDQHSQATLIAKTDGVLCGIDIAMRVFQMLDCHFSCEILKKDGDRIEEGDHLAALSGKTRAILKGERTALNILQHMSGIATYAARCVAMVQGTSATIVDTRKTLPGLRPIQKYAVTAGGARNHRYNLSDGAMIKDNHIDAAGGIINAVQLLRSRVSHMVKIEVETRSLQEVSEALEAGADVIMLDNMDCNVMREAVELVAGRAVVEASGGITGQTLREVAKTGVDIISIGALTHSVTAMDISLKFMA